MGDKLNAFIAYIECEDDLFREGVSAFTLDDATDYIEKKYTNNDYYRIIEVAPIEETQVGLCFYMSEFLYIITERPTDEWFEPIVAELYDSARAISKSTNRSLSDLGFYELLNVATDSTENEITLRLMMDIEDVLCSHSNLVHGLMDYEMVSKIADRVLKTSNVWTEESLCNVIGDFIAEIIECNYKIH